MEKEKYTEFYLPFAKTQLIKASQYFKEKTAKTGKYKIYGKSEKIINSFFPKLINSAEEFSGSLYSVCGSLANPLPDKWVAVLNYLKSKKIISEFKFLSFRCDTPKIIQLITKANDDFRGIDTDGYIEKINFSAGGYSIDLDEAVSKLIGEALERYLLLVYKEKNCVQSSARSLFKRKKRFLNPFYLSGFSSEQKENNSQIKFNADSRFLWSYGKSLFTGKKTLIPTQLIFWNYNYSHNGWQEPMLRETNTNGGAGYFSLKEAILAGLYELVQRDGFLIYWLNNLSPLQIDQNSIEYEPLQNLLEEIKRCNLEAVFFSTITDLGIPSCVCIILDHSGTGPKLCMGGGCSLNWNQTLMQSLIEALVLYNFLSMKKTNVGYEYPHLSENYRPFQDNSVGHFQRLDFWANEKMFEKDHFFFQGKKIKLDELKEYQKEFSSSDLELDYLTKKFKSFGKKYEIFYYQIKNEILDDLGYEVVKVIVPSLMHLYLNEVNAPLGTERLKETPSKLGFSSAEKFNPWPHPFP